MSRHAFYIAGNQVLHIANPGGAGLQYQARQLVLAPDEQSAPQRHETAETALTIISGTLEVMVNGAAGLVGSGSFVRVPAGSWFAYRNAGSTPAILLLRTAPATATRSGTRITIHIAAA